MKQHFDSRPGDTSTERQSRAHASTARLVLGWEQAFEAGASICGGKGYNLARLDRYGFRVPEGCVITASAYDHVLAAANVDVDRSTLAALTPETCGSPHAEHTLARVRERIEAAALPIHVRDELRVWLTTAGLADALVAVRSSALAEDGAVTSFAGIHRSLLNVRGLDSIERAVLACYGSLWTPHAVAYRRRMSVADDAARCAVVVCKMVTRDGADEPACAGVAFSCDPRSGRRDLIVIEAAQGSGERVVSGQVAPEHLVFRRSKGVLAREGDATATALLTTGQELELAALVERIHWSLGEGQVPQDVEWAHDGRAFYVLQSRPVTRLPRSTDATLSALPTYWSNANIKDAVPGVVSWLSWSWIEAGVFDLAYAAPLAVGAPMPAGVAAVRRFHGRAYFDLTLMQWVMYDALGVLPSVTAQAIGGHQPEIAVPPGNPLAGREGRRRKRAALKLVRRLFGVERALKSATPAFLAGLKSAVPTDLAALRLSDLAAVVDRLHAIHEPFDALVGLTNAAAGAFQAPLEAVLRPAFGTRASAIAMQLLAGTGAVTSAEQGYAVHDLAAAARGDAAARAWLRSGVPATTWPALPETSPFREGLRGFLAAYGHRAVYEAEVMNPRWQEDPAYVVEQVRQILASPALPAGREAARAIRLQAEDEVRRRCGWRRPVVAWLAGRLRRAMAARELAKSTLVAALVPMRRLALELGRRLVAAGHLDHAEDVFDLTSIDLVCVTQRVWDGRGARELAADRKAQRLAWLAQDAPDVIVEEPDGTRAALASAPAASGDAWAGIGVAPGRRSGNARLILHPKDGSRLAQGEVLVAPSTDPGWTPLFTRAAAIVMETGGYLSHGAIVAREYGIPAVVNIPGVLRQVNDGERLEVDGEAGRVVRVNLKP